MSTDDAQSNGTAGFASSDVKEILVGGVWMFLRLDKLGSRDCAPSRGSRRSPNRRRRCISSSGGDSEGHADVGEDRFLRIYFWPSTKLMMNGKPIFHDNLLRIL